MGIEQRNAREKGDMSCEKERMRNVCGNWSAVQDCKYEERRRGDEEREDSGEDCWLTSRISFDGDWLCSRATYDGLGSQISLPCRRWLLPPLLLRAFAS